MDTSRRVIGQFRGAWEFLSNFYRSPLTWEGIEYPTAEHAFQAGKTTSKADRRRVAAAGSPGEAKGRGRSLSLRPGWDERVRFEVMAAVLRAKFAHSDLHNRLLATGESELVEGNTWHDQVWGNCLCGSPACATPGQNHLGRLLVELRHELINQPQLTSHNTTLEEEVATSTKKNDDLLADLDADTPDGVIDLLGEIDEDDDAEAWRPEPGDGIQGTVLVRKTTTSDYVSDVIPVVVLQTPTGKKFRIIGYHKVLRDEITEIDPQPGDLFGCKYFGKKENKKGTGAYEHYKAAGRKATVTAGTKAPF
jgi:ribA/ribD-fused uncharacterized protein